MFIGGEFGETDGNDCDIRADQSDREWPSGVRFIAHTRRIHEHGACCVIDLLRLPYKRAW